MTTEAEVKEIQLAGERLREQTNDLSKIIDAGSKLYDANKEFIREQVPDNWFVVIDPASGKLIAADSQIKLYTYTHEHYPTSLYYFVGLLKNRAMQVL